MTHIAFPSIGLEFDLNRVAFTVFGKEVYWYGIILASAFILAALYALKEAKKFGISQDNLIDQLILALPLSVVGARLYYVIFDWASYKDDPAAIIRIWDGGLAIYGAVITAVVSVFIFCRVKKLNPLDMLDLGSMGLLIGQAVGRWGNFINAEVYGSKTTLPWGMEVANSGVTVHPLFIYESLWNILGLLLISTRAGKRWFRGEMFLMYIAWYGIGRGFLEGLRQDQFILMIGRFPVSQLLAILSLFAALVLLAMGYRRVMKQGEPEGINDVLVEPAKKDGAEKEPEPEEPAEPEKHTEEN